MSQMLKIYNKMVSDKASQVKKDVEEIKLRLKMLSGSMQQASTAEERIERLMQEIKESQALIHDEVEKNNASLDHVKSLLEASYS